MALMMSIYGTYDVYLWYLRFCLWHLRWLTMALTILSMAPTMANYGTCDFDCLHYDR